MFTIEMLPARQGDCLWIEFGQPEQIYRILIDGGVYITHEMIRAKLQESGSAHIDLLIITHIDNDHLGGVLRLLENPPAGLTFGDIWFNDLDCLKSAEGILKKIYEDKIKELDGVLGPNQAQEVSEIIDKQGLVHNHEFQNGPVVREKNGRFPVVHLHGMTITLLGPTHDRLVKLIKDWEKVLKAADSEEQKSEDLPEHDMILAELSFIEKALQVEYKKDRSTANGSSISVLLEYDTQSLLCLGDAFPEDMVDAISDLCKLRQQDVLPVTATKISHHGGKSNTTIELIKQIYCSNWLVSTDGSGNANHPHAPALARVVKFGKGRTPHKFIFNYASKENAPWRNTKLQQNEGFTSVQPESDNCGIIVDLNKA